MNRRYAHVFRAALAVLAAAGTVWLAAFFLPGAVVEPIPLLPTIGGAAVKVVTAPVPTPKRAAAHVRTAAIPRIARAQLATVTLVPHSVPVRPAPRAVQRPQRGHPRVPAPRPKRPAPVPKAVPASTPASPPAAPVFYGNAPSGRAVGWHRKHDRVVAAPVAAPPVHEHGHGHGRGHGKHDAPAAQPAPTPAAPAAPPANAGGGHDHGKHLGDEHGHGDDGDGPGGKR